MRYTCTDENCQYCYIMNKQISNQIPYLPKEFREDIERAGGWYNYRDTSIIENVRQPFIFAKRMNERIRNKKRRGRTIKVY